MTEAAALTAVCIDDHTVDLMLTERVLRRSGYFFVVETFTDAAEALRALSSDRTNVPDVVFLDINMPCMSGFDFLEAHRGGKDRASQSVVMLTSSIHPQDQARALTQPEVIDYVVKPLRTEDAERLGQLLAEYADILGGGGHGAGQ